VFDNLIAKISEALVSSNIPYMIIGGQAVLLYGEPRLTKDIDITLGFGIDKLDKIKKITSKLGLKVLPRNVNKFIRDTYVLPVADKKTGIRIDFIFSFTPYEQQAIKRSRKVKIKKVKVNFAAVEDIIIHKIIAGRQRDIEDVGAILLKNPDYDRAYILKWLKEFDAGLKRNYSVVFRNLED